MIALRIGFVGFLVALSGLLLHSVVDLYAKTPAVAHDALFVVVGVIVVGVVVLVIRLFRMPMRRGKDQSRFTGLVVFAGASGVALRSSSLSLQLVALGALAGFLLGTAVLMLCLFARLSSEQAVTWANARQLANRRRNP